MWLWADLGAVDSELARGFVLEALGAVAGLGASAPR
jgi:hypothetical protein